jgi:hypothetical protein
MIILVIIILVRIFEFYFFMKRVNNVCMTYDWKYVDENEDLLPDMLQEKYYLKAKWSAYNFLFLKGPHPFFILLSFKILTFDNIYNKDKVDKIRKYEII